jgi:hypothetical protein
MRTKTIDRLWSTICLSLKLTAVGLLWPIPAFSAQPCDQHLLATARPTTFANLSTERWIEPVYQLSPGPEAKELIKDPLVAIRNPWISNPNQDRIRFGEDTFDKMAEMSLILVPKGKYAELESLIAQMDSAPSYSEGIHYLKNFMQQIGLIQIMPILRVVHGSDVPPNVIAQSGLLSSKELEARGLSHSRWGQNIGDGLYFVGISGWGDGLTSTWGKHQYVVTYENESVLRGANRFLAGFVKIYDAFREKWHLSRYDNDSIMAPGLPQGVLSYNGLLSRLPSCFSELGVIGVSSTLEILIKRRVIEPYRIRVLEGGRLRALQ